MRLFLIIILGVLFSFPLFAGEYKLDPAHTSVTFHIGHFGFSYPSGKWMANGTVEFDPNAPEKSKVNADIDIASVLTGIPELDKHLKGKEFFEVEKFPKATFVSTNVKVENHQVTEITGDLTVHGVTHPVTLKITQNKIGTNPLNDRPTIGFSAEGSLKRSDFGIITLLPNLSDEVKLNIEAEGYQDNAR